MHIIEKDSQRIALKFGMEDIKDGLSFFSKDGDVVQVGTWKYQKGKNLLAHIHNFVERKVDRTQEFVFVVKGAMKASVYDENESLIEEVVLNSGEGMILFSGGHGYDILEDDTVVIEMKNGPYLGAEIDRRRI